VGTELNEKADRSRPWLKSSIVEVRVEENCLAHALIKAIARLNNDPNYTAYFKGRKLRPVVRQLLESTGIDL